ncbi:MAG: 1-acyl-sn-glycerol-3-phosphate acyltransferase [Clostridia bacterium]|nr:1-acyl-sn-glycerol-3-phosphate acyltransferase [Clostridia bacterium]
MKIKTKNLSYEKVMSLKKVKHFKPIKPSIFFRTLIRVVSIFDLISVRFKFTKMNMEKAGKGPYLILMNHSSFIDLEIAYRIMYPKPMCIICTSDGFVGKSLLMRLIGCIPTQKFVTDLTLIRDIIYTLKNKNTSILMYPEASYSFDGTATPLPRSLGTLVKRLGVPVVNIHTYGAFARQPLYNCLKKRNVKVSADVECLLSSEEITEKTAEEIQSILDDAFTFDNFAWQKENNIEINEEDRAVGLERILYKCAHCSEEGGMLGKGSEIVCEKCGKKYSLTSLGKLYSEDGTKFDHIPDWYAWERKCVQEELMKGEYKLDTEVEIGLMIDHKAIYMVGDGRLTHDEHGFNLTGCEGKLSYSQKPLSSYGLYADYFWYEIGDVICIGDKNCLYYCFPKDKGVVSKTRIAAEELYKIAKESQKALAH